MLTVYGDVNIKLIYSERTFLFRNILLIKLTMV